MDLRKTKYKCIKDDADLLRLCGKYGFVFLWKDDVLAACLVSPRVGSLTEKFLKEVPNSKRYVQGDWESIILFGDCYLKEANNILKLFRKSSKKVVDYNNLGKSSS